MNKKTFITRTISAIAYAAMMIFGLWYSDPIAVFLLTFVLLFFASRELCTMLDYAVSGQRHHWIQWLVGLLLSTYFIVALLDKQYFTIVPLIAIPTVILSTIPVMKPHLRMGQISILSMIIYIAVPLACMIELRGMDRMLALGIVILIWINDTMAYIIGSIIGKTPLSPISPKKTWEGTIGGILLTILIAIIIAFWIPTHHSWQLWAALAAVVSVFGNIGDLLESYLKRTAGVKDSGNIMPGHGGALDRLDSILMTFPVAYALIIWMY